MGSNIIELAKLGHERASELKASCGAVNVRSLAQLISDLATQLEVQLVRGNEQAVQLANAESKCSALAAENACLKQSIEEVAEAFETGTDGVLATAVDESLNLLTPETDAVLKRIQAHGVAMFASKCKEESKRAHSSGARDSWWVSGENADDFAAQLRKGAAL
ncbi:hypothetical protein AIZ13_18270 [Salmonella enterica subsp. enterica serovar Typhimurium]|uniref:hypothetical protein n=1 Tax=Salmonella enterica TaxID=28901 RepID=UPI0007794EDF|nr:hypothetical protein [Salmonella enterica]KYF19676.1 hypothetical protein AIZ04_15820 [Salmonella enterica subsp. enterica serovar Typhimurium]KYF24164.1 hypothetical protein AIZ13_18270 [Salmonella enterica subsp. enterica serovar Typhimurium]KYI68150.1 hypothetical protein AIZ18_05345 [Salmonella enterica subsp. enterica serovar Typhimurium]KYI71330.1 hypothetical protein AIZ19_05170 [Salmonella enterica subsp. enterica serovar Typhimurium]KYI75525.1 hypothetical protein AIZ17_03955 [Salm